MRLGGVASDCACARNGPGRHQVGDQTVAGSFIPSVTVSELKSLLAEALGTAKVHATRAGHMVAGLPCG